MKKTGKLVALFLTLTMVVATFASSSVFAAGTSSFFLVTGGVLTKYSGNSRTVTIPNTVTSIGDSVFDDCTQITSIVIPKSVTRIGANAFYHCTGLTRIVMPSGVTEIDKFAFAECTKLKNISIPNTVTNVGENAFKSTPWLNSQNKEFVILGEHVLYKYLGAGGAVTIPSSVTNIAGGAFKDCSGVTSILIPSSVILIGEDVFGHTNVTISGYEDTEAQVYANENNLSFQSLGVQSASATPINPSVYDSKEMTTIMGNMIIAMTTLATVI